MNHFFFLLLSDICSLSNNDISDGGMGALAGALQVNQSLHKLE